MAQLSCVLVAIRSHRDRESQVLDRRFEPALPRHRHAEPKVRVVVVGRGVDQKCEVGLGVGVVPGGKTCASQGLAGVAGFGLGGRDPGQDLHRGGGLSFVKEQTPPAVPAIEVSGEVSAASESWLSSGVGHLLMVRRRELWSRS